MESIHCSLGILVRNEEANIGRLPAPVHPSTLDRVEVPAIIVVAKGCSATIIGIAIPITPSNRQPTEPI